MSDALDVYRQPAMVHAGLPRDEAFGVTVDGTPDELWERVLAHPLVRASDRRSPYPPPPEGAPLLATRDGDVITLRYWRPRVSKESLRLELRSSASTTQAGRTKVEGLVRSTHGGMSRWRQRDEFVEDVVICNRFGLGSVPALGLAMVFMGGTVDAFFLFPVVVFIGIVAAQLRVAFSKKMDDVLARERRAIAQRRAQQRALPAASDGESPPESPSTAMIPTRDLTLAPVERPNSNIVYPVQEFRRTRARRQVDPEPLFTQLLADLGLHDA